MHRVVRNYIDGKPEKKQGLLYIIPILGGIIRAYKTHKVPFNRYVAFELTHLALWWFTYQASGFHLWALFALPVTSMLLSIAFIDGYKKRIPTVFTASLMVFALVFVLTPTRIPHYGVYITTGDQIAGFLIAFVIVGIIEIVRKRSNKPILGGNDIRLLVPLGLLLGWHLLIFGIGLAAIVGALFLVPWQKYKGEAAAQAVPFGPFLSGAFLIAILMGLDLVTWYLDMWT